MHPRCRLRLGRWGAAAVARGVSRVSPSSSPSSAWRETFHVPYQDMSPIPTIYASLWATNSASYTVKPPEKTAVAIKSLRKSLDTLQELRHTQSSLASEVGAIVCVPGYEKRGEGPLGPLSQTRSRLKSVCDEIYLNLDYPNLVLQNAVHSPSCERPAIIYYWYYNCSLR